MMCCGPPWMRAVGAGRERDEAARSPCVGAEHGRAPSVGTPPPPRRGECEHWMIARRSSGPSGTTEPSRSRPIPGLPPVDVARPPSLILLSGFSFVFSRKAIRETRERRVEHSTFAMSVCPLTTAGMWGGVCGGCDGVWSGCSVLCETSRQWARTNCGQS